MGVHAFPVGISLKLKLIVQLDLELAFYYFAVQDFCPYASRTPLNFIRKSWEENKGIAVKWTACSIVQDLNTDSIFYDDNRYAKLSFKTD